MKKLLGDKMFWRYVAIAAVVAAIMIISAKYEIDWVETISTWISR
jgi:hypothetical protein